MKSYINGNYVVMIKDDGTKIRFTQDDELRPAFPENIDIKITDRCDLGCAFCYENSTINGQHADLFKWGFIDSLHPFTEVALNGNDLTHPDLLQFLEKFKEKQVFTNLTVNQIHFLRHYDTLKDWCDKKLIYGLGISLLYPTDELIEKAQTIPNAVIHTINGVVTCDNLTKLSEKGLKILILGYKSLGRGITYQETYSDEIKAKMDNLRSHIKYIIDNKLFNVLSFDNLALEQLKIKDLMTEEQWNNFYMGDDGDFTFYIDMVKGQFARNSIAPTEARHTIDNKTVDEMFDIIRKDKQQNKQ